MSKEQPGTWGRDKQIWKRQQVQIGNEWEPGCILHPNTRTQAEVRTAAGSTKHPGRILQGLEGSVGTLGQEMDGAKHPTHPLGGFALSLGPLWRRRAKPLRTRQPLRRRLSLWNNRWCFYNLSEACSWADGESQYLRTTGLREVVKVLLPVYIFLTMLSLRSVSFFFFELFYFIFILLPWQSVSPFFFFLLFPPLILPFLLWPIKL